MWSAASGLVYEIFQHRVFGLLAMYLDHWGLNRHGRCVDGQVGGSVSLGGFPSSFKCTPVEKAVSIPVMG